MAPKDPKAKSKGAKELPAPELPPAPETTPPPPASPAGPSSIAKTHPDLCRVSGDGLRKVAVKQYGCFTIEAYDEEGKRKTVGGDAFFIAIRGASRVRAKVTDMRDGTYVVEWKPSVSGSYHVAVSLFGNSLPGSPYRLEVDSPFPYAPNCEARGEALRHATARVAQTFEMRFRDRLGNVAQAVDLDVFVQPYHEPGATPDDVGPQPTPKSMGHGALRLHLDEVQNPGRALEDVPLGTKGMPMMVAAHDAATGEGEPEDTFFNTITKRQRTINIQVGDKPLVVRAHFTLDSPVIGQLVSGQLATVIEERIDKNSGDVRACITIDEVLPGDALESARGEQSRRTPRSGKASPRSAAGAEAGGGSSSSSSSSSSHPPPPPPTPPAVAAAARVAASTMNAPGPLRGWVTLIKDGRRLVTSRVRLHAGQRQQHMNQWQRRMQNDKVNSKDVSLELATDPMGIGFAFGGLEPGLLHSGGKLHPVHRVSYSIGVVGRYLLHVRLRQAALPVPGSPFTLTVTPGKPHAALTRLPPDISKASPLRGMVGLAESESGCRHVLQTSDKMGNVCVSGGADVTASCSNPEVESSVVDQHDGTYQLRWRSKLSGTFEVVVRIDGEDIVGSPFAVQFTSSSPELGKSTMSGAGLKDATAGIDARLRIGFFDKYGNSAVPKDSFKFGISMLKEKEKFTANSRVWPHKGEWFDKAAGVYELSYVAQTAGTWDLHVWCDPQSKGERLPFPGSPFAICVGTGKASALRSHLAPEQNGLGWSKETRSVEAGKQGKQQERAAVGSDLNSIVAGDTIVVRPQIQDEFGNPTIPPEGAIVAFVDLPNGQRNRIPVSEQSTKAAVGGGGAPRHEVRFECTLRGQHVVHVELNGSAVSGSPVSFVVLSSQAEPSQCKLLVPKDKVLYANAMHTIVLETNDKFGNRCNFGGLMVQPRLQLIKQGMNDQTILMPNNHEMNVIDKNDGTYQVNVKTIKIPASLKLIVNMDKNIPASGGELPPVFLSIVRDPNDMGQAIENLQKAGKQVIQGLGEREERTPKDLLAIAVEAFKDAGANTAAKKTASGDRSG